MWIEELQIDGFGKLTGSYRLGKGLNLVSGPNEAGKSTLHHALIAAMFGFTSSERRRRRGASHLSELAPWSEGAYGMTASVHTESGALRIEWAFDAAGSSQSIALFDDATGEDLSDKVRLKHGDATLGRFLLGLDHEEYCQTCTVEQAAIGAVRRSDSLEDELRRAAEVGNADVGVDRAAKILRDALGADDIGVRRGTHTPLANGALRRATTRRQEAEAGLELAAEAREELERRSRENAGHQLAKTNLDHRILELEQGLLLARTRELGTRVSAAEQALEMAQVEGDQPPPLDADLLQRVRSSRERFQELGEQLRVNEPGVAASTDDLTHLQKEINDLDRGMLSLAPYESVDASQRVEVEVGVRRLREAELSPPPIARPAPLAAGASSTPAIAAGVVAVLSLVGGAVVSPALFAGVLVAIAIYIVMSRGGGRPGEAAAPPGAPEQRPDLAAELTRVLDSVLAPQAASTEERAIAYIAACDKRAQLEGMKARRLELDLQRTKLQAPLAEQERLTSEQETVEEDLRGALAELGIHDLGAAGLAEFERLVRAGEEHHRAATKAEGAAAALDAALAGQSMGDLREELGAAEGELAQHRAMHGELSSEPLPEADLEGALGEARGRREELAGQLGASSARLEQLEAAQEHVPELRADLEAQEAKIDAIARAAKVIATAEEELEKAAAQAHRRFAPILNKAIEQDLPSITGDRYREARVSEELEITLVAPETNSFVSAERLSRGTQDQIYLVERFAILDVLASTAREPAPLLLDDAFAYFDDDRLYGGLELLARKAADRQVVLLVDDPRIPAALTELEIEHDHLELEGPA